MSLCRQDRLLQQRAEAEDDSDSDGDMAAWDEASTLVYSVLDSLSQLLSTSGFVAIVTELLHHDDPQVHAVPCIVRSHCGCPR